MQKSRTKLHIAALLTATGLLAGCTEATTGPNLKTWGTPLTVAESPGVTAPDLNCDAGDKAFVRNAMITLWGRRARSQAEVDILAGAIESQNRAGVLRAMMRSPEFLEHWHLVLRDMLFVNRSGRRTSAECFDTPLLSSHDGSLAAHIRDHAATETYDIDWNLSDLVRSAIVLDDISPLVRGWLFAQGGSVVIDADDLNDELSWRRLYSAIFEKQLLARRMECLTCHNSEYSVTPDTTFPMPGHFETAVYGGPAGRAADDVAAMFRIKGVLAMDFNPDGPYEFWLPGQGLNPWGMTRGCGEFVPPEDIGPDETGMSGFLIQDYGTTGSLWDLERMLQRGFDQARDGLDLPDTLVPEGEEALGWMVSSGIALNVWTQLVGSRLVIAHNFPRNPEQRDVLSHLTATFAETGYSLRELLVAALTHPYLNQAPPAQCDELETGYNLAAIFEPWRSQHTEPDLRNNSAGDVLHRLPANTLVNAAVKALGWTAPPLNYFPDPTLLEGVKLDRDAAFIRDLGGFMSDGEAGFRGTGFQMLLAWEERIGGCRDPFGENTNDYITKLIAAADGKALEQAVFTLKDRLVGHAHIEPAERPLLEALLGQSLEEPVASVSEEPLRRLCLALLSSPRFLLSGVGVESTPGAEPTLIVEGEDPSTICTDIASLFGDNASCDNARITF
jgi:hypothetical protein